MHTATRDRIIGSCVISSPTFGPPNNQGAGCDEQQPKCEFRLLILYRPTNTGSASLRTSVVLVRAMVHQVQDVQKPTDRLFKFSKKGLRKTCASLLAIE